MPEFCHLHCHTQYSLLDGAANIDSYMKKAKADGMKGLAITDHGNMFGVFKFYDAATREGLKPIIGCEFYLVEDRFEKEFKGGRRDNRYHQLMLAKNEQGYRNLSKLCSLGFIEGLYSKYPRIDKELIRQYKEGLIVTTCCVAAEVPQTFLHKGPEEAERVFLEWLDLFGDDYYVELQRHGLHGIDQEGVNRFLLQMAAKHGVKVLATNDSHYVEQEDWLAHDILLCVNTGDFQSVPVGESSSEEVRLLVNGQWEYDTLTNLQKKYPGDAVVRKALEALETNRGRKRFGFENDQFYFKTGQEMADLFKDVPQAIDTSVEIYEKITSPDLKRDILLPNYTLPEGFTDQWEYLSHITFEKARQRFAEFDQSIAERLEFELQVIKKMGFAGYFLIVQDFVEAAKKLGVRVGPGRGSAAGSAIAYAIGITNIDPIKYNLLFERFLNPERVSMPDIDIDFDDANRQKVIDYVVDTYGKKQVAQIITYGTMAAKSSIRDVGRVLQYPLSDTDKLAKLVPDGPGVSLTKAFDEVKELKDIRKQDATEPGKVLKLAEKLEGSVRQRGIHAAGVIIAPDDLTDYIPVCTAADSDLLVTQFEGKYIEEAGMLKMDFLGLKTLSILNDALRLIKKNHGKDIDLDTIPLDDPKTIGLYQRGDTVATFQFESEGMRKYLRELKPTNIEDLIAMNALYRPGPMDYIPSFIDRKHGRERVDYPHPSLQEMLQPTYGIMVYQEQIMQCAQIIGGFSLGKADILRRAMGKKKLSEMKKMEEEFVAGAAAKSIEEEKAKEIFKIMEAFAKYGFNRSHSAAYTVLAFQTGYLKANYPAEYMAAVLSHNMTDIKKLTFFLQECSRMNLTTLGPDINESDLAFMVNKKGEIRFALAGIKGVGQAAVEAILEERQANGAYTNLYDLTKRANLRAVNKKALESLIMAGAFDSFEIYRSRYFLPVDDSYVLEKALRFGNQFQQQKAASQHSLFGEEVMIAAVADPEIPQGEPWSRSEMLDKELEVTGMYISGHPLDDYQLELSQLCKPVSDIEQYVGKDIRVGGMVKSIQHRSTKTGKGFGLFTLEDFSGTYGIALFGESYINFRNYLEDGLPVLVSGRYQARYSRNPDEEQRMEFQVGHIELLSSARDKYSLGIELALPASEVDEALIDAVENLLKANKGNQQVKMVLLDRQDRLSVSFNCRKYLVTLSNEFIKGIEQLQVNYKLIPKRT